MAKSWTRFSLIIGAAIACLVVLGVHVRAEIVDEATLACRGKATVAQADQLMAENDQRSYHKLVDAKTRIGECKPLKAHTEVKVENRSGDLACVKAKGDTKCSWVSETALRIVSDRSEPVRQDYFACKSPLYLDTGRKILAANDPEALNRFRLATTQSAQCLTLHKGDHVEVEKRKDQTFCVRPVGEDECYWTDAQALPPNL